MVCRKQDMTPVFLAKNLFMPQNSAKMRMFYGYEDKTQGCNMPFGKMVIEQLPNYNETMNKQPDVNAIINELSNQIAVLARENAILKSIILQYEENEKVANAAQ